MECLGTIGPGVIYAASPFRSAMGICTILISLTAKINCRGHKPSSKVLVRSKVCTGALIPVEIATPKQIHIAHTKPHPTLRCGASKGTSNDACPVASTDAACLWAPPPDDLPMGLVLTVGHQLTASRLRGAHHDSSLLVIAAAIRHLTSGWAVPLHGQAKARIGAISRQLCARQGSAFLRCPTSCLHICARVRLHCGCRCWCGCNRHHCRCRCGDWWWGARKALLVWLGGVTPKILRPIVSVTGFGELSEAWTKSVVTCIEHIPAMPIRLLPLLQHLLGRSPPCGNVLPATLHAREALVFCACARRT